MANAAGYATATGLSAMMAGEISHDEITRLLSKPAFTSENEIICWHYDHDEGRSVRCINLLNALYSSGDVSIPVAFEIICKPIQFSDVASDLFCGGEQVVKI